MFLEVFDPNSCCMSDWPVVFAKHQLWSLLWLKENKSLCMETPQKQKESLTSGWILEANSLWWTMMRQWLGKSPNKQLVCGAEYMLHFFGLAAHKNFQLVPNPPQKRTFLRDKSLHMGQEEFINVFWNEVLWRDYEQLLSYLLYIDFQLPLFGGITFYFDWWANSYW